MNVNIYIFLLFLKHKHLSSDQILICSYGLISGYQIQNKRLGVAYARPHDKVDLFSYELSL